MPAGAAQVGQRVFALGFPFALDQSLSAGIVSGLGREITGVSGRVIRDVVQTDAGVRAGLRSWAARQAPGCCVSLA